MALASDAVHDRLRDAILAGELAPGDPIPSERELSESEGVNRHAVREAVKRLQQARLVQVAQGGATRVLDWRSTGGLDLLLDVAVARGGRVDADTLRAIVEMRACIGIDAARLCAARAPARVRRKVAALAGAVAAAEGREARDLANGELWDAIVEGSGNLAYRLALNTLLTGMERMPDLAGMFTPPAADDDLLRALATALRTGDATAAAAAAQPQLERPLKAISRRP